MAQSGNQFVLPDLFAELPFKGAENPLFHTVSKESRDWINSYEILPHHQRAGFDSTYGELLASHVYPYAPHDPFRVCADFVNVLFMLDEVSDIQDPAGARETIHLLVRALRNDPDCDDGSPLSKMLISFTERFNKVAAPNCQRRFYRENVIYMEAVQKEAEYRASGKVVAMEHYYDLRRGNGAMLAAFALMEPGLGIDLADEVVEHPAFKEVSTIGMDLVCLSNDLYSFNIERSRGIDGINIITILMVHKGYTLQQAVDHVGETFAGLVQRLLEARQNFPSFGPEIDCSVSKYIDAIETWVVGNLNWSFISKRYFRQESEDVRKTGIVKLYPRKSELQQKREVVVLPDKTPEPIHRRRGEILFFSLFSLVCAFYVTSTYFLAPIGEIL